MEPDPLARRIGQRVRELRLERDLNFDAFVEMAGLGRGYISELERGMVVPSVTALSKLARALSLTPADLVLGDSLRERLFEVCERLPATDLVDLVRDAEDRLRKKSNK